MPQEQYFFRIEKDPIEVAENLICALVNSATYVLRDDRNSFPRQSAPHVTSVSHSWTFSRPDLTFSLEYNIPQSQEWYHYVSIQGKLTFPEDLSKVKLKDIRALLEKNCLSTTGSVKTFPKFSSKKGLAKIVES